MKTVNFLHYVIHFEYLRRVDVTNPRCCDRVENANVCGSLDELPSDMLCPKVSNGKGDTLYTFSEKYNGLCK